MVGRTVVVEVVAVEGAVVVLVGSAKRGVTSLMVKEHQCTLILC